MTVPHLTALAARALTSAGAGQVAKTGEAAKSGPIGFAVILVLCVVCYFLFKSMSRHLRKVREEFPADEPPAATSAQSTSAAPPAVTGPAPQVPQAPQESQVARRPQVPQVPQVPQPPSPAERTPEA